MALEERLMGKNPIEELLSRLEVLAMEQSRRMVGQTLEVVSHLITDTGVIMEGVDRLFTRLHRC